MDNTSSQASSEDVRSGEAAYPRQWNSELGENKPEIPPYWDSNNGYKPVNFYFTQHVGNSQSAQPYIPPIKRPGHFATTDTVFVGTSLCIRAFKGENYSSIHILKKSSNAEKYFEFPLAGLDLFIPSLKQTLEKITVDENGAYCFPGISESTSYSCLSRPEFWSHKSTSKIFFVKFRPFIADYQNVTGSHKVLSFRLLQEVPDKCKRSYNGRDWIGTSVTLSLKDTRGLLEALQKIKGDLENTVKK